MIGGMVAAPTTANHRSALVFKNGRVKRLGSVRPAQIALDQYLSTSSDYVRVMDQRLCQWLLCQANSYPVR